MRIAILDDYIGIARSVADWSRLDGRADITIFTEHLGDIDRLATELKPFEALVLMRERTAFPRALLERLPNLQILLTGGMGNRAIDMGAANDLGILVCGTESLGYAAAELSWGLILSVARNIPREDRNMREGGWQLGLGMAMHGKTLGILGLGKLGTHVGKIGAAFGMNIIAWSPNLTEARATVAGARYVTKEDLFALSDVLTIQLVLSERTRGLVGASELGRMKPSAILVNTSRAAIVQQQALIEVLEKRAIAGAGLDVFDIEPLPGDSPMRRLPNAVITPHLGYFCDDNVARVYGQSVENLGAILDRKPLRMLNPDILKSASLRRSALRQVVV